jgi:hypothetical protein
MSGALFALRTTPSEALSEYRMNRSFESPASITLPVRRSHAPTSIVAFVVATTIGGLPFASLAGFSTSQGGFGLQSAVAAAPTARQDSDRDAARKASSESRWQDAVNLWTAVLNAAPGDAEAVAGREQALAALNQASTASAVEQDIMLRQQRARAQYISSISRANDFLAVDNFKAAERELITAGVQLDNAKGILPPGEYATMKSDLQTLQEDVAQKRTASELNTTIQQREAARKAAEDAKDAERRARERSIDESLKRVRQLQLEMK